MPTIHTDPVLGRWLAASLSFALSACRTRMADLRRIVRRGPQDGRTRGRQRPCRASCWASTATAEPHP